jgi:hypothetical protein
MVLDLSATQQLLSHRHSSSTVVVVCGESVEMSEKTSLLGRKLPFDEEKLAKYRNVVYYLTFLAYAMSHFSRKSYTNVKVQMKGQAGMDPILLSQMDTAFMFFYAIGSYFSGRLGDMFHAPTIIGCGLLGSAACVFLLVFGISEDFARTNVAFASFYFLTTWTIHGLFQSTGGPVRLPPPPFLLLFHSPPVNLPFLDTHTSCVNRLELP